MYARFILYKKFSTLLTWVMGNDVHVATIGTHKKDFQAHA